MISQHRLVTDGVSKPYVICVCIPLGLVQSLLVFDVDAVVVGFREQLIPIIVRIINHTKRASGIDVIRVQRKRPIVVFASGHDDGLANHRVTEHYTKPIVVETVIRDLQSDCIRHAVDSKRHRKMGGDHSGGDHVAVRTRNTVCNRGY